MTAITEPDAERDFLQSATCLHAIQTARTEGWRVQVSLRNGRIVEGLVIDEGSDTFAIEKPYDNGRAIEIVAMDAIQSVRIFIRDGDAP